MNDYPLLNFNTESFSLRLFSNTEEEISMINEFEHDDNTREFLTDFKKYIFETEQDLKLDIEPIRYTNIAYYEDRPVGLITFLNLGNELIFSHGIRPSERGNRFSSRIKREVFDYAFRTLDYVEKITVFIDSNNENNLHSLQKLTYDEIEKIWDEKSQKEFLKVSNNNPYLENKKSK